MFIHTSIESELSDCATVLLTVPDFLLESILDEPVIHPIVVRNICTCLLDVFTVQSLLDITKKEI